MVAIAVAVAACSGGSSDDTNEGSSDTIEATAPIDDGASEPDLSQDADNSAGADDGADTGGDAETGSEADDGADPDGNAGVDTEAGDGVGADGGAESDTEAGNGADEGDTTAEEQAEDDGPKARWETVDSDYLFDQDQLHTYELTISDENLAFLDSDPAAEEYVEGSLTFEGETLDAVGIRYKGSVGSFLACTDGPNPFDPSGSKTCDKLSMKIKINWEDNKKIEFYGLRKVQLHALNLDSTLMHDRLGYWMFEQAGVVGPRSTHARLMINGEFAGLFAMTEQIDGRLVRDRFEDGTGNIYKEAWPFDDKGNLQRDDVLVDSLKTNEDDDPNASIMLEFAQAILDAGAADDPVVAREVLDEWTDIEAFIAYAVIDRAIAHDDGPFHWYCIQGPCLPHNFYWYEDPTERKLHMIPWDLDNAFASGEQVNAITEIADEWGQTQGDCAPFPFGSLSLRQRSAACDPLVAAWSSLDDDYNRIRSELLTGPVSVEMITERLEAWETQIAPVVAEQEAAFEAALTAEDWQRSLSAMIDNLMIALEV